MAGCWLAAGLLLLSQLVARHATAVVYDFDDPDLPALHANAAECEAVASPAGAGRALRVTFRPAQWPAVVFPADGAWDWSDYSGLAVDVTNPGDEVMRVFLRANNPGPEEAGNWRATYGDVPAGGTATVRLRFRSSCAGLWGMRGYPSPEGVEAGPPIGRELDPAQVVAFLVAVQDPPAERTVLLEELRLWGEGAEGAEGIKPFVDRFGQYAHDDWPGKVHSEEDLAAQADAGRRALQMAPDLPGRDEHGGRADGPQLEATGWFRAEKVDGRWWLVTPGGRLFFSNGVDCVRAGGDTFVTKREDYFRWLPPEEGEFAECWGLQRNIHSHADPIKETGGQTFDFYRANLIRKHGAEWRPAWTEAAFRRLRAWGFNTIGNWSDPDLLRASPLPFTATVGLWNVRRLEGGEGYWGKMPDPYGPAFDDRVDAAVARVAAAFAQNPLCIGYFVDNELAWGSDEGLEIAVGALASPPDQPARQAFVSALAERYSTPAEAAKAWGTSADDWGDLHVPEERNDACRADCEAFIDAFAREYFRTVADAVRRHAPNQLYLGCRFAWKNMVSVRACAEFADVVSFNCYAHRLDPRQWAFAAELDRPCIIGEFHFGARDRGMLHPGLVEAGDQEGRARMYADYVGSVADHPAFVGCHWFQYVDQPLTGRPLDGENYNIGLVTVTDSPYPELTEAARRAHADVYARRHGGGQ